MKKVSSLFLALINDTLRRIRFRGGYHGNGVRLE